MRARIAAIFVSVGIASVGFGGRVGWCNWRALADASSSAASAATVLAEDAKLLPSDGAEGDDFGYSVAVSGDVAVIGALGDSDSGIESGSAYVFVRAGEVWTEQAKLLPSDGAEGDDFGNSVAVSGDVAVIGARGDYYSGIESGWAYVFVRTGEVWTEQAKLLPSDGAEDAHFGNSVAVSGDVAVIGAWGDNHQGIYSGSAYVFARSGEAWIEEAKLVPSDGAEWVNFGYSVAVSGDVAVIGAPWHYYDNGFESGAAYVFARSGEAWIEEAKLLPSDGMYWDRFGDSVAISGDVAVIGIPYDRDNGIDSGSAYVFVRTGEVWTQQTKLLPSDGAANDYFGDSVAVSGDVAVIGAYGDSDNGYDSGSAYIFETPLFTDGFESGDTSAWNGTVP